MAIKARGVRHHDGQDTSLRRMAWPQRWRSFVAISVLVCRDPRSADTCTDDELNWFLWFVYRDTDPPTWSPYL